MAARVRKPVQRKVFSPIGVGKIPLADIRRAVEEVAAERRSAEAVAKAKLTPRRAQEIIANSLVPTGGIAKLIRNRTRKAKQ